MNLYCVDLLTVPASSSLPTIPKTFITALPSGFHFPTSYCYLYNYQALCLHNLTCSICDFLLQVVDSTIDAGYSKPSFKQVVIQDHRTPLLQFPNLLNPNTRSPSPNDHVVHIESDLGFAFAEDNFPIFNSRHLSDVSHLE